MSRDSAQREPVKVDVPTRVIDIGQFIKKYYNCNEHNNPACKGLSSSGENSWTQRSCDLHHATNDAKTQFLEECSAISNMWMVWSALYHYQYQDLIYDFPYSHFEAIKQAELLHGQKFIAACAESRNLLNFAKFFIYSDKSRICLEIA